MVYLMKKHYSRYLTPMTSEVDAPLTLPPPKKNISLLLYSYIYYYKKELKINLGLLIILMKTNNFFLVISNSLLCFYEVFREIDFTKHSGRQRKTTPANTSLDNNPLHGNRQRSELSMPDTRRSGLIWKY